MGVVRRETPPADARPAPPEQPPRARATSHTGSAGTRKTDSPPGLPEAAPWWGVRKVVAVLPQTVEAVQRAVPPRPWLRDPEAAVYVGKTPRWMREQAERRVIPFSYSGRTRVWHVDDLDAYLRSRRVEAGSR